MIEASILTAVAARLDIALAAPAGLYWPLCVGATTVGWLDAARVDRLRRFPRVFEIHRFRVDVASRLSDCDARTRALDQVARALAAEGQLSAWRDERHAVAGSPEAPPLFLLERAGARYFGVRTHAAHLNGLVQPDGEAQMWIARRSPRKAIDPGQLDNLVGGGVAAHIGIEATVVKEAFEEAGIPSEIARRAQLRGELRICRAQPDGLQRETIHVHDLVLPDSFVPRNQDGEVVGFRRVSAREAARLVAASDGPDLVTADASLVIVDWLLRSGLVGPESGVAGRLAALRCAREPRPVTPASES